MAEITETSRKLSWLTKTVLRDAPQGVRGGQGPTIVESHPNLFNLLNMINLVVLFPT